MALKLTRRALNRRLIAFAVSILTSVSLVTAGFTAFIVSSNAKSDQGGNVEVGAITEASMHFLDLSLGDNPNFIFEPVEGDESGRLRSDGKISENLTVTLSGRLDHSQYLDKITLFLQLPDGVKQAVEEGFLRAPACAYEETTVATRSDFTATASGLITFSFDVSFAWGEKFGYMNPSIYFDSDVGNELYSDDEVVELLQRFRMLVYGIDDPNATSEYYLAGYDTYYLTITAYTN